VFEYLLNFDFNLGISAKILHITNQLKFRAFDLQYVEQMFKLKKGMDTLFWKVFERSIYQMSNTKIAQDVKNYAIKSWLKLISKINYVFRNDFKALYKYLDDNNLKYLDENGVQFSYYFIPVKHLDKRNFSILINELMFFRASDIKLKSKASVAFFVRAVKNKNFECTPDVLERICYDVRNIFTEIRWDSDQNADMYLAYVGYILAHILFSRGSNKDEFMTTVERVKGYFESVVDLFHPMTPRGFNYYCYKKTFSNFVGTYCKQFKKYTGSSTIDVEYIRNQMHPVIKRILNFATLSFYWDGLDEAIVDVCCLDTDYFLSGIMSKIQMGYDMEEFRKEDLLRSIKNVSPLLRTEKTCHYLKWVIPTLIKQMETSDSENLQVVTNALISMFQNFIKINETNHDHLKEMREMVVSSAIRVLKFYYDKGDTFEIEPSYLEVICAMSSRCKEALFEIVKNAVKDNFFRVKPKVGQMYVNALYLAMPERTTALITDWIRDKVIVPCDPPAKWGKIL
jgi:hypothetical protein